MMPLVAAHMTGRRRSGGFRRRLRQSVFFVEAGFCVFAVALFVYAFYHFAINSPRYRVQDIIVFGNTAVSSEEVVAATQITTADSLLFLDKAAVAKRVASIPYVASAEVQRELPSTLIIHLTERQAAATLLAGRRAFLIDRDGVVLKESDPGAPVLEPLITNAPGLGVISAGIRLEEPAVQEALKLWEAYSQAPIASEVNLSEISAEGPMNLTMIWDEAPYEVRWGRSDYKKQAERLSILWKEKGGLLPCQEYLDLRFDQDLVCR
ncbi:MAG: FtsQ-type POTRA domain-containing protein [Candidatus Hydrogenedentes bacterium]|nr:FtsQ-type POTRA domain-containing protein [Candidatus Hydrogenedentota bacterium]